MSGLEEHCSALCDLFTISSKSQIDEKQDDGDDMDDDGDDVDDDGDRGSFPKEGDVTQVMTY